MQQMRSDLALEAQELWKERAQESSKLDGVIARSEQQGAYEVTHVEITNEEGARALGKPCGRYITLSLPGLCSNGRSDYVTAAEAIAAQLGTLLEPLPPQAPVLVVGLGNRHMTPDAIGPHTLESLFVTRHLVEGMPEHFGKFRPVSALAPGVMGDTGLESGELLQGLVRALKPACVIAVDALASRSVHRLFCSVQLTDTGIAPGSGVGNHRLPLTQESLGVPVIAIGVPTVVDGATLCMDLLEKSGQGGFDFETLLGAEEQFFVTPREVDRFERTLSKVLGLGLSLALHTDLSVEDVEMYLS